MNKKTKMRKILKINPMINKISMKITNKKNKNLIKTQAKTNKRIPNKAIKMIQNNNLEKVFSD